MRIVRRYPEPDDPILRFFDEESIPHWVWGWPPQERAQRLRYALISLCAGNHPVVAWPLASDTSLEMVSDSDIEEMLASTAPADWIASSHDTSADAVG